MNSYFDNILVYCQFVQLSDDEKRANKIKVGAKIPRFDCVAVEGYYKPLFETKNKKGQLYMYLNDTRGIIKASEERRADRYLQTSNSFNFSSVFLLDNCIEDESGKIFVGFGTPNGAKVAGGKDNPFFEYKDDGFIFLISNDWRCIELIVMGGGKYTIQGTAKGIADNFGVVKELRKRAKVFFDYRSAES